MLGALLSKESGLGDRLVVVGGSAITIYTNSAYVSGDFHVVGGRTRIIPVLKRWGLVFDARYWRKDGLGLAVEPGRTRYRGLLSRTVRLETKAGPVRLAAPEDLIVRRLIYAKGEYGVRSRRALDEAILLYQRFEGTLDRVHLAKEVRHERVAEPYSEMLRRFELLQRSGDRRSRPERGKTRQVVKVR